MTGRHVPTSDLIATRIHLRRSITRSYVFFGFTLLGVAAMLTPAELAVPYSIGQIVILSVVVVLLIDEMADERDQPQLEAAVRRERSIYRQTLKGRRRPTKEG
jgi:membrane protein implicated in regulation of membrane protease activity